jgi:hypothetical protein
VIKLMAGLSEEISIEGLKDWGERMDNWPYKK